jgi:hypothetical protein
VSAAPWKARKAVNLPKPGILRGFPVVFVLVGQVLVSETVDLRPELRLVALDASFIAHAPFASSSLGTA